MPKPRGNQARIALLRLQISRLLVGGATERQIARQLGKAPSTVHFHIVQILKSWQAEMEGHRNRWVASQLAKITQIENMAFEEFELSKQGKTTLATKAKGLALLSGGRRRKGSLVSPLVEIKRASVTRRRAALLRSEAGFAGASPGETGRRFSSSSLQPFLVEHEPDVNRYERARGRWPRRLSAKVQASGERG